MRQQGLDQFGGQFTAERRVFACVGDYEKERDYEIT